MIELIDVCKRYRLRNVLGGVSFTAAKGEITCLVGLNGAGKSTILKAIMGLVPVHSGSIRIDGEPISTGIYNKIAFIPDHLTMPLGMRLSEALTFMADFYPLSWNAARAEELLRFFKLAREDKLSSLSRGTAAKFNLVVGLAQDTDYVIMDEPFSGIDLFSREQIAEVFSSELIEGRGVLFTTHEINEMEHLIDKAVLLRDGVIGMEFYPEQMREEENKSIIDVMREAYRQ